MNMMDEREESTKASLALRAEHEEKIERVLIWAEDYGWFNTKFVESLKDWLAEYRHLTDSQVYALDNIIERFEID